MNTEQKRNVQIGLFAVMAVAILCVGLNYLKGRDLFSSGAKLTACYASVDGLTDSSPILYHGFKIGSVKDIYIDQYASNPDKVFTVVISIEKNIDVPADSRAEIVNTDLLGGKGIEIVLGHSADILATGDTIMSGIRTGLLDELGPVKDQASALMTSATGVMNNIDTILDASNRQNIDAIIASLNRTMRNIEDLTYNMSKLTQQDGAIGGTFRSTNDLMGTLNGQSARIDSIMSNATAVTSSLAKSDIGGAVERLDSVLMGLNNLLAGQGNISKFANDAQLYDNMTVAIDNLNRLLVDIRLNPSRYINVSAFKFGGKQVYFSDTNTANNIMRGTVYAICLTKVKQPIDAPSFLGSQRVLEYCYDGKYKYLVVPFSSEAEAQNFLSSNNVKSSYPDAVIETYVDGIKK